jgi:hypothetical protein
MYKVVGYFKYGGENYTPGMTISGLDPETEKYLLDLGERIEPMEESKPSEDDAAAQAAAAETARQQAEQEAAAAAEADRVEALRQQGLDANGQPLQPQQPAAPQQPVQPQQPAQPTAEQIANDPQLQ